MKEDDCKYIWCSKEKEWPAFECLDCGEFHTDLDAHQCLNEEEFTNETSTS